MLEIFVTHVLELAFSHWKMMTLQDNINNFKHLEGEPIYEKRMRFENLLMKWLTHGIPDKVLLQYFYRGLDSGVVDQLSLGGIMRKPYAIAFKLLNRITKIKKDQDRETWLSHYDDLYGYLGIKYWGIWSVVQKWSKHPRKSKRRSMCKLLKARW